MGEHVCDIGRLARRADDLSLGDGPTGAAAEQIDEFGLVQACRIGWKVRIEGVEFGDLLGPSTRSIVRSAALLRGASARSAASKAVFQQPS